MKSVEFYNPTDQGIERKRRMAKMLMENAKPPDKTEMVSGWAVKQSPWAGMARALQQGMGGYYEGQADRAEVQKQDNARKTMADALDSYSRSQAGGQTQLQNGEAINWNKQPIDQSARMFAQALMANPDTAPLGMQAQIGNMESQQKAAQEMEMFKQKMPFELDLARQKAMIDSQYAAPPVSVREFEYAQKHPEFADFQKTAGAGSKIWQDAQNLVAASEAAGEPMDLMTAYSIAKSGLGVGRTMAGGIAAPVPGALDTAKDFKSSEAAGKEVGKEAGEAEARLNAMTAQFPRLEQVTKELSDLGKKATYTQAGQLKNTITRELGVPVGEGANARAEYIAKVDNEILPLLRQTFGAQFTQKEGESLKVTLGDPNKSPSEKDAALKAFITQKAAQIATLQIQVGPQGQGSNPAITQPDYGQIEPDIKEGAVAVNPQTGERLILRGGQWLPQ